MKIVLNLAITVLISTSAVAQFGGLPKIPGLPGSSPGRAVATSAGPSDLPLYLATATNQGMKAMDELAAAFPPEKVAAYQKLSAQYHQATAKRTDGIIDAESFETATLAAEEMAKLENDWQGYNKDGAKNVRKAHERLGLMLLADAYATTLAPAEKQKVELELRSESASAKSEASRWQNIAQGRSSNQNSGLEENAKRLNAEIALLASIPQQAPRQQTAFKSVQHIAKNISNAERFKLPDDPAPGTLTTNAQMTFRARAIDDEPAPVPAPVAGQ